MGRAGRLFPCLRYQELGLIMIYPSKNTAYKVFNGVRGKAHRLSIRVGRLPRPCFSAEGPRAAYRGQTPSIRSADTRSRRITTVITFSELEVAALEEFLHSNPQWSPGGPDPNYDQGPFFLRSDRTTIPNLVSSNVLWHELGGPRPFLARRNAGRLRPRRIGGFVRPLPLLTVCG